MFFAEYSLLALFDTYPASKCTTQNMYTRVCAGHGSHCFTQDSARLPERRRRKKEDEEDEQFAWAAISVYHFRNVCQPR